MRFYGDVRGMAVRFGSVWPLHVTAVGDDALSTHPWTHPCCLYYNDYYTREYTSYLVLDGHVRATFTSQPLQLWEPARMRLSLKRRRCTKWSGQSSCCRSMNHTTTLPLQLVPSVKKEGRSLTFSLLTAVLFPACTAVCLV